MRAKRIDETQNEIVNTLRRLGCRVSITSALGNGFPDLVVLCAGWVVMVEVKNGNLPLSRQRLTVREREFFEEWIGHVTIIRSVDEAVAFVHQMTEKRCRLGRHA